MKTLIVYYTRTNKNKKIAKELKEKLKADIIQIKDTKDRSNIFFATISALLKSKTKIKPIKKDLTKYKNVILCTPIWCGTIPPATRAFLKEHSEQIRHYHLVSISKSGKENKDFINQLERVTRQKIFTKILLKYNEEYNIDKIIKKIKNNL